MELSKLSEKKSPVKPPGIDPETLRLVAQCLNPYATPGPDFRKRVAFLKHPEVLPACPSDMNSTKMKVLKILELVAR
jgi:hypothetical protein